MRGRQRTGGRLACDARDRRRAGLRRRGLEVLAGLLAIATAPVLATADTFYFKDRAGVTHFTNVPTDARYKVLKTAKSSFSQILYRPSVGSSLATPETPGGLISLRRFASSKRVPEPPADLAQMITDTARSQGVDVALVHAVVRAESGFDYTAVSRAGAMGLMQLMPGTADLVGVRNAFHPRDNVEGGVYYLRQMLERFEGNVQLALAAYNAGPGAVESYGGVPPYSETQGYVERVFRYRQEYLHRQLDRRLALVSRRAR